MCTTPSLHLIVGDIPPVARSGFALEPVAEQRPSRPRRSPSSPRQSGARLGFEAPVLRALPARSGRLRLPRPAARGGAGLLGVVTEEYLRGFRLKNENQLHPDEQLR